MKYFYLLWVIIVFISCGNDEKTEQITNPEDYNSFLFSSHNKSFSSALSEKIFWSKRLRLDSTGVGDLGPLANAYTQLFETTGEINYLISAEKILLKAIQVSAISKDSYTRSLANNYISQHRFNEAKLILEESYKGKSNKIATRLMLFDVYLELGEYEKADKILGNFKNTHNYNYLIRLAKWNDHMGNLKAAIRNLEKAKNIAESRKSIPLQIWTYTNLADFYGHAGKIKEAYSLYIKTLQLQADNAYAKKQIAWIVYSFEKNTSEALRILDSITENHKSPAYLLFKAELLEFEGKISEANKLKKKFIKVIKEQSYSDMYNSYLIEVYSEINPIKAVEVAQLEINNRATPEIYSLLAYAQFKAGNEKEALQIILNNVEGKTFNPKSLYFSALIFNANKKYKKVKVLKQVLLNATYELGPKRIKEIKTYCR